jgi:hypothetical protein
MLKYSIISALLNSITIFLVLIHMQHSDNAANKKRGYENMTGVVLGEGVFPSTQRY